MTADAILVARREPPAHVWTRGALHHRQADPPACLSVYVDGATCWPGASAVTAAEAETAQVWLAGAAQACGWGARTTPILVIPAPTFTAAIESLRNFAVAHDRRRADRRRDRVQLAAFAHLCTVALAGEGWAVERVAIVVAEVARTQRAYRDEVALNFIRATDTVHPAGAIAH